MSGICRVCGFQLSNHNDAALRGCLVRDEQQEAIRKLEQLIADEREWVERKLEKRPTP